MTDYIFSDGSIESKVLQHELKSERPQIITVDKFESVDKWLQEIVNDIDSNEDITRVFLHFSYDQITPGIRAEVNNALSKYPNLRIVLQYQQMDKRTIQNKASIIDIDETLEANKDKIKTIDYGKYTVGGESTEVPAKGIGIPAKTYKVEDPFTTKYNEYLDKRRRKKSK